MAETKAIKDKIVKYGIFPAIGIGRVGNSEEYFIGPEIPNVPVSAEPSFLFKDKVGLLKKQAVRYRIYGYDALGNVVKELTTDDKEQKVEINWSIQLANKKASHQQFLGIENKDKIMVLRNPDWKDRDQLNAISKQVKVNSTQPHVLDATVYSDGKHTVHLQLGKAWTEKDTGRLIVVGGNGYSNTIRNNLITQYANNDYWYDDTSDGPITADVTVDGVKLSAKDDEGTSWFLAAPPKFAPSVQPIVPLHQVILETQGFFHESDPVSYYEHIYPIFESICNTAWLNPMAFHGHGPKGYGNFLKPEMQEVLKSNSPANLSARLNVFQKIRIPPQLANRYELAGQAYPYYMPALSGNNGDDVNGDPTTWMSLSPGQYKMLQKWANGDFVAPTVTNYLVLAKLNNFDFSKTIPLQDQPNALSKAALQWCIGGPFFPGIEITFISYNKETFSNVSRYRIDPKNPKHGPGDITKWMALPWQADFNECADHWWPTQRPDIAISVTDLPSYKSVDEITPDKFLAWTRGFRQNEPTHSNVHWGDVDMVNYWSQLGFLVPATIKDKPLLVETERNMFAKPPGPEHQFTVDDLVMLYQTALAVELATIPAYLYAMYSIKTDVGVGAQVSQMIHHVAMEEMLHASLVANMISAIGYHPKFYSREMVPFYPNPLPHVNQVDLTLNLSKASYDNIETFVQVEKPATQSASLFLISTGNNADYPSVGKTIADVFGLSTSFLTSLNLKSIAEFYDLTVAVTEKLALEKKITFDKGDGYQLVPGMGYSPRQSSAGGLMKISSLDDVKKAVTEIITQGEGSSAQDVENSHYQTFLNIQTLIKNSSNYATWNVVDNPFANSAYSDNPKLGTVATAFDASYSFLLLVLERSWATKDLDFKKQLVVGALPVMMKGILAPLAQFLVSKPLANGQHAGPTFAFFNYFPGDTIRTQLLRAIQAAVDAFPDSSDIASVFSIAQRLPDFYL